MHTNTRINDLLFPEAIEKFYADLEHARTNWDYLSGISGNGPIEKFEKAFVKIAGGRYSILVSNCTSALFIALLSTGVKSGDEVILPAYTWPQTLTPVLLTGATPVFADIGKNSVNVNPDSVAKLVTHKTKAIIVAHLFGIPADVETFEMIAKKAKCTLIFDAAQGFGAMVDGKPLGNFGEYVAFSFGRSKLFSIGEGGALVCNNRKLYEYTVAISQHPLRMHRDIDNLKIRNSIDGVGMNFRIHPLIASLAFGQLEGLIKSGKGKFLSDLFMDTYKRIKTSGGKNLLPDIPPKATPSGITLPIILETYDEFYNAKSKLMKLNLEIYEAGFSVPLHLTPTIQQHRLFPSLRSVGINIPEHETHQLGSCPNAEQRCDLPQLFVKFH